MARPPDRVSWWRVVLFVVVVGLVIYAVVPALIRLHVPFIVRAILLGSLPFWGYRFGPLMFTKHVRDDERAPIESDHA